MTLSSANEAALEFGEIHPFFAGLLVELPKVAAAHDRAQSRLYPAPVAAGEEELCADWSEVVQPGLQHLFAANREIVTRGRAPVWGKTCWCRANISMRGSTPSTKHA